MKHADGSFCACWRHNPAYAEIEALILAGWGNMPQTMIPKDWRSKQAPPDPSDEPLCNALPEAEHATRPRQKRYRRSYSEIRQQRGSQGRLSV